jgi:hypothetical protein
MTRFYLKVPRGAHEYYVLVDYHAENFYRIVALQSSGTSYADRELAESTARFLGGEILVREEPR